MSITLIRKGYGKNWVNIIGSKFMIIRLNTKQLVTEHISLIIWTSLRSPSELPNGFTKPFLKGCCDSTHGQTPVQFACHCYSSLCVWTHCCLQVLYFHILHIKDIQYPTVWRLLSTGTTWSVSVHDNPLQVSDTCSFSLTIRLRNEAADFKRHAWKKAFRGG